MRSRVVAVSLLLAAAITCAAQSSIREDAAHHQWILNAGESTYVIGFNDQAMLQSLYWGPKLADGAMLPEARMKPERASFDPPIATTPLEYPAWGAGLFSEPALKVDSPNGDRTLILKFDSAHLDAQQLELVLKDVAQPLAVHLFYRVYPQGVIARWSRVENVGKQPFRVEQAMSAVWNLPQDTGYSLSWLTGQWGGEWQLHTSPLETGAQLLESRRGSTSHQANPWFAIGRTSQTTETAGPVWFGELGWSGSWRMMVESTSLHNVRVSAGYNPYDYSYTLGPGQSLETPEFYAGYTAGGHGEASRILHRFQLAEILPGKPDPRPRPIIYNSWEATEFDVTEAGQMALADKAAKLGVERFVVDDGWFGQRANDKAGLGDWYVNQQKFPHGLKPLIDHVNALGMDFGLWVEPEMVNPDSDLYRRHPDWAMQFPGRQHTEQRNQLVLNLARPDVVAFVFQFLDKLLTDNNIAFLKWDYNRNWSEPGWATAPGSSPTAPSADAEKQIYVQYMNNLYDILQRLRAKHPEVEIESCSGGGGRVDLGILRYTDEVWTSDNTDALDRLGIQFGYTHAYSPETMVAWVTDVPNFLDRRVIPLQFRFVVAMQGALGIGANLNKWTPEEMESARQLTAFYKTVRTTVQHGKLYRLQSPLNSEVSQVECVAQDGSQAVLLAYLHSQHFGLAYPTVPLQGLDSRAMYRIHALDNSKYSGETTVQGSVLMGAGVELNLAGDYDSTALEFERLP